MCWWCKRLKGEVIRSFMKNLVLVCLWECIILCESLFFSSVSCSCVWEWLPERGALHRAQQMCLRLRFHWPAVRERWVLILVFFMLIQFVMILSSFQLSLNRYDKGLLARVLAWYFSGKTQRMLKQCHFFYNLGLILVVLILIPHMSYNNVIPTMFIAEMWECDDIQKPICKFTHLFGSQDKHYRY